MESDGPARSVGPVGRGGCVREEGEDANAREEDGARRVEGEWRERRKRRGEGVRWRSDMIEMVVSGLRARGGGGRREVELDQAKLT